MARLPKNDRRDAMWAKFSAHQGEPMNRPHAPLPIRCIVGDTICRVQVWSDVAWQKMDVADRPHPAEYFPGLGWVGAVLDSTAGAPRRAARDGESR